MKKMKRKQTSTYFIIIFNSKECSQNAANVASCSTKPCSELPGTAAGERAAGRWPADPGCSSTLWLLSGSGWTAGCSCRGFPGMPWRLAPAHTARFPPGSSKKRHECEEILGKILRKNSLLIKRFFRFKRERLFKHPLLLPLWQECCPPLLRCSCLRRERAPWRSPCPPSGRSWRWTPLLSARIGPKLHTHSARRNKRERGVNYKYEGMFLCIMCVCERVRQVGVCTLATAVAAGPISSPSIKICMVSSLSLFTPTRFPT